MIEGDWCFCGPDTFDVPSDDGKYYLHNAPFLDYEFAGIIVDRILMPWRSQVLQLLSDLSYQNKKANWFALLLANFVLQHTFGLLMRQQRALAVEFKKPVRPFILPLLFMMDLPPLGTIHIHAAYQQYPSSFQNSVWTFSPPD